MAKQGTKEKQPKYAIFRIKNKFVKRPYALALKCQKEHKNLPDNWVLNHSTIYGLYQQCKKCGACFP